MHETRKSWESAYSSPIDRGFPQDKIKNLLDLDKAESKEMDAVLIKKSEIVDIKDEVEKDAKDEEEEKVKL